VTAPALEGTAHPVHTRVVYLAPRDILVARVARKCMMHMCEALTMLGVDVELICLRIGIVESEPTRTRSIWDVYGIQNRFRLTMIRTPFLQERMDGRAFTLAIVFYRLLVYPVYAFRAHRRPGLADPRPCRTVFYSRNYACAAGVLPLRGLLRKHTRVILELHTPPRSWLQCRVVRKVDGVACQSQALQTLMIQRGLLRHDNSVGRHGGHSPGLTESARISRSAARAKLGWNTSDRVACYTGKVFWGAWPTNSLKTTFGL
jgi:hypothetical protein